MADRPSSRHGGLGGDASDSGVLRPAQGLRPMQASYGGPQAATGPGGPLGIPGMAPAPWGATPGQIGTAMRPPTGQRMATAQRLSTAQRAARPGSRGGIVPGGGVSANIQVADRPVTQQGMMGMKTGAQGPGRQVADKTYYLGELRNKISEMTAEIEAMETEMGQYNSDNTQYATLERRYEGLVKDVRELQGSLADYNLILDMARTNIDVTEIREKHGRVRRRNEDERKKVDAVFTERSAKEQEIRTCEEQIARFMQDAEAKLNELAPEKRRRYTQLQQMSGALQAEATKKQEAYDQLCRHLAKYEAELKNEPLKQKLHHLQEQRHQLEERKTELLRETSKPVLTVPEIREKLLEQVKDDNKQIAITERKVKEMEGEVRKLSDQLAKFESGGDAAAMDHAKKYEQLLAKDQEMQQFIDDFDKTKADELQLNAETQRMIASTLQHISKDLVRQRALPSADKVSEMRGELDYKEMRMEQSQTTADRLQQECELRQSELEKIKNLDTKIVQELASLGERMSTMQEELVKFSDIEKLKSEAEAKRKKMVLQKNELFSRKEALKQQVQLVGAAYESRKQRLTEDEAYQTLDSLEQKLRHYEQVIFNLQDYVEQKARETDYGPLLADASNCVAELNDLLCQSLSSQAFTASAVTPGF